MDLKVLFCAAFAAALAATLQAADDRPPDEYVHVEIQGILHTGIVVIGGEATGYVVRAAGVAWELEFREQDELKNLAEKLDKRPVVVSGRFRKQPGVEVGERFIITVAELRAAK